MASRNKFFFEVATWPARNVFKALGGIATWANGRDYAERLPREPHHGPFNNLMADIERAQKKNDQALEGHATAYASRLIGRTIIQGNVAEAGDMAQRLEGVMPEDVSIVPLSSEELMETIARAKEAQRDLSRFVQE